MKYPVRVYWSEIDNAYIADAVTLKGCCATGDTAEEAIREIETAMELWIESAKIMGKELPRSNPTTESIIAAAPLINLSGLAQAAGLPKQTLMTKLRRGTQFTKQEQGKLNAALTSKGVRIA